VPGLLKQTSTPDSTNVRTRLSAPFMRFLPEYSFVLDLSVYAQFSM